MATSFDNAAMREIITKSNYSQKWQRECPIDQLTKTDVASIIRRATAGQPILGDPNRVFDGSNRQEDVSPTAIFSWDLDTVSSMMKKYNASTIEDLQAKLAASQKKDPLAGDPAGDPNSGSSAGLPAQ